MDREHILRWLIEFGTDWVSQHTLRSTWADYELDWMALHKRKWLKIQDGRRKVWFVRLTEKAIKSLGEQYDT